jgi:hypothetical protein
MSGLTYVETFIRFHVNPLLCQSYVDSLLASLSFGPGGWYDYSDNDEDC